MNKTFKVFCGKNKYTKDKLVHYVEDIETGELIQIVPLDNDTKKDIADEIIQCFKDLLDEPEADLSFLEKPLYEEVIANVEGSRYFNFHDIPMYAQHDQGY